LLLLGECLFKIQISVSSPTQVFIGAPEAFSEAEGQIASQEFKVVFQILVTVLFPA